MKNFRFLSLILLICILISATVPTNAMALEDPAIGADAVVLMDPSSGQIFFSNNENEKVYPASLTKIMTVLLAIEAIENGEVSAYDEVTASENISYDLIPDGSSANITAGETMTLENLLYCAIVSSANEACNVIAEYIGGTVSAFIGMMNDRANELGCTGTHFNNTHGLPDENHYTTAWDFTLIAKEAVNNSLFMQICDTVTIEIPATNSSEARILSNTNGLINENSNIYPGYYYEYAAGVKTGYTSSAGYCLISTASKDGINLMAVVMGGKAADRGDGTMEYGNFTDTIALYEWVFNNFSFQEMLKSTELVKELDISMASDTDTVSVRPQSSINALLPNDTELGSFGRKIVIYSEQSGEELKAPIDAGTILGEITVSKDGVVYGTVPLVANSSVELSRLQFMKSEIAKTWDNSIVKIVFWLIIILAAAYIALVVRYRILRRRHLRKVREAKRVKQSTIVAEEVRKSFISPVDDYGEPEMGRSVSRESSATRRINEVKSGNKQEKDYFEEFFGRNRKDK